MAAFDKLRFYIIKRHKGNKNMRICIEKMYGEAYTSSAIGQQVTRLEFLVFLAAIYGYRHQ